MDRKFLNKIKNKMNHRNVTIVDILSFRGSDYEAEIIGVLDVIRSRSYLDRNLNILSKHQEIIYGITKSLIDSSDGDTDIILYSQLMGRSYNDISRLVDYYFKEYNFRIVFNTKINTSYLSLIFWKFLICINIY